MGRFSCHTAGMIGLFLFVCPAARADLHFAEPSADLGQLRGGVPLVHTFHFTNRGARPVEIVEVRGGCGCVVPTLTNRMISAGAGGTIPVEVNTLGQPEGAQRWHVYVRYRAGDLEKQVTLELLAKVVTEVTVQPAALKLYLHGPLRQTLRLLDLRPTPLQVLAVRGSSSHFRVTAGPQDRDEQGRWVVPVRLDVTAELPAGRHEETLDIYTDDPVYRHLKVPVSVTRQAAGRVSATPAEVHLTGVRGSAIPSRVLLLRHADGARVEIDRITADDPALRCRWAPGPGALATVRVQIDAGLLQGDLLHSAIHVHLAGPDGEVVTVPVDCRVE